MPRVPVQLGPNVYYGDIGPENPVEGAEWRLASGQAQVFIGGKWRSPPVGYVAGNGAGGTVTQITSKATGVALNALTGTIVTHNANLATLTPVAFIVTNTLVAAGDVVAVNVASGAANAQTYLVGVGAVGAGTFTVVLFNTSAGTLGEALTLNFAVVKGASS